MTAEFPPGYRVITPDEAEKRFAVSGEIWYPYREFADEQERSLAVRELVALGAREAIMTLPDGCFAQVQIDGQPTLLRARIEPREPIAKRGSGDAFLAGYVAARYTGSPPAEFAAFVREDIRHWAPVVKQSGATPN